MVNLKRPWIEKHFMDESIGRFPKLESIAAKSPPTLQRGPPSMI
jgi:hypothetical protein